VKRPILFDLFCCQGGAGTGYDRAGFEVIGVDIEPQPRYPYRFVQANAMQVLQFLAMKAEPWEGAPYPAAIHASPPCQRFTTMSTRWRLKGGTLASRREDLLTPTLALIRTLPIPYVVENVPGAKRHMRPTLLLHGGMFGLRVHRPRLFESSAFMLAPMAPRTRQPVGVYGDHPQRHLTPGGNGSLLRRASSIDEAREVMGMPWADWHGCKEAIPPAYTEFIGRQLIEQLAVAR
jgi:DNA (cytosine-5)-methyltransferase 1